jgi:phospholipid transport system transporter-binding protein
MSAVRFENDSDDVYRIIGELNMNSVPGLFQDMNGIFMANGGSRIIDLADVTRSDSAGLALLLEWQRIATERNIKLSFRNVPEQMQAIIDVSGLEDLISA